MNLRNRLEKLESARPTSCFAYCLVLHEPGKDHKQVRAEAIAAYVQEHGRKPEPDRITEIRFISADTKKCTCGCQDGEVVQ